MQITSIVLVTIACLVSLSSPAPTIHHQERISVIGAFREQIEQFRRQMACGVNGGPPLAPLKVELFSLTFDEPPNIESTGHASNVTITGLDDFVISNLDFNLFRMRLDYTAFLPETRVTGAYKLNATIFEILEMWGEGPFEFILTNAKVDGYMILNLVRGFLNISELHIVLSLEGIESHLEGVMDDQEATDFYNDIIEQLLPWILDENQHDISAALSAVVRPMLNQVVNQLTLADLIGGGRSPGGAAAAAGKVQPRQTDGLLCEF